MIGNVPSTWLAVLLARVYVHVYNGTVDTPVDIDSFEVGDIVWSFL